MTHYECRRIASESFRAAMQRLIPAEGAVLTPQLVYRIKSKTLDMMKARGLDLSAHKREVRVEFLAPDRPNLVIPPHLLNPQLH